VAIPDDMAVSETLEARATLDGLGLALARPVLNRVWPRRFTAAEANTIAALRRRADEPLLAAAGLHIAARPKPERHLKPRRAVSGVARLPLHEICREGIEASALADLGRTLERGLSHHDN